MAGSGMSSWYAYRDLTTLKEKAENHMNAAMPDTGDGNARQKVSISPRLIAAAMFTIPLIGGALSSFMMLGIFRAIQSAENAGVLAVVNGMKESSLPAIVSLYLAAGIGLVVLVVLIVRMIIQTKKTSPPFWFYIVGCFLSFVPVALFWMTEMLILDVLSPGSAASVSGMAGSAPEITTLLTLSIAAAPIVFLILLGMSVVPLSSRPGPKAISLITAAASVLLFLSTAVAIPYLIDGPRRTNETVELPANVKYATEDGDISKESAVVLTLTADNKLLLRDSNAANDKGQMTDAAVSLQELEGKIQSAIELKSPDKRTVYLKSDVNASNENVLKVLGIIRDSGVDRVGLVVIGIKSLDDPYQTAPVAFEVRLPEEVDTSVVYSPNPLTLVAALDANGRVSLNNQDQGQVTDPQKLQSLLTSIFKDRENNGVFREGTNEVEKTVIVKIDRATKYGDMIKLIETVKGAGAQPIEIQID
jgi:biopolymer transport protein ExbD